MPNKPTPEREALIRSHFIPWNWKETPTWRRVIWKPMPPTPWLDMNAANKPVDYDFLEYRYERGHLDGVPTGRVVCEGVTVFQAPRSRANPEPEVTV